MFWSKSFIPTLKETPQEAESVAHKLMLRAGLIRMLISGVYSFLPLGLRVLDKIKDIIRQEMNASGAAELLLSSLQPLDLWAKTGRDKDIGEVMFRFQDRKKRNLCLGPTHEEIITDLVAGFVSSYKQLPLILYQIQTKFRDEIRPRFGLVRACEFVMKDAYSFDADQEGLKRSYKLMYDAYARIFQRCGLNVLIVEADPGIMGGDVSHEFMVPAASGEDIVFSCSNCKTAVSLKGTGREECPRCKGRIEKLNALEVGHIFQLGTKYSSLLEANFLNAQGKKQPIIMGCYGIGVSRLISAIIEQNNDTDGIIWPSEVSPYKVIILPLDVSDERIMLKAHQYYDQFNSDGIAALLDDRDERAGVKFKDADLLGISAQLIIGQELVKNNKLELKLRNTKQRITDSEDKISDIIKRL